ncbi:MAG TPA: hypothetical protein PLH56_02735 [Candidatus Omnitrophota bacterium]|nr:hypothetical protein [Candidatus Omnitrophota bacterium]
MKWDKTFFIKQVFSQGELLKYKKAAERDLVIAESSEEKEVVFHFTYMAFIKMGIYYIAKEGYRVKSSLGHHQKIIEALSQILDSKDVLIIGDSMRKARNLDFYSATTFTVTNEVKEYLVFVKNKVFLRK